MNILLLLSALLSACTGVLAGGGAAVAPPVLSRALVSTQIISVAAPAQISQPIQRLATIIAVAQDTQAARPLPAPVAPIYASRRRE